MAASISFGSNLTATPLPMASTSYATSKRQGNVVSCKVGKAGGANLYRALSLDQSQNVGMEEIKKAYRAMALQYHPDVCPPSKREEFTRLFVEAHEAYKTLSDSVLRRRYDCELALTNAGRRASSGATNMEFWRREWDHCKVCETKKRSECRMKKKREGSLSGRIRAKRH